MLQFNIEKPKIFIFHKSFSFGIKEFTPFNSLLKSVPLDASNKMSSVNGTA